MPLQNLNVIAQSLIEDFRSNLYNKEIILSDRMKERLREILPEVVSLDDKTGTLRSSAENIVIFPYQYFLYAVKMKPLVKEVYNYHSIIKQLHDSDPEIFKEVINSISEEENFNIDEIRNKNVKFRSFFMTIDGLLETAEEKQSIISFLCDRDYRFRSKELVNLRQDQYILRNFNDFYGSFFLKIVNIPDVTAAYLGDIICLLCFNPEVFEDLCSELSDEVYPGYLLKDDTLIEFIYNVILYMKRHDHIDILYDYVSPNSDPKFYSLHYNQKVLTSIFWVFDHEADENELHQGGMIRTFRDHVFIRDGKYFYLSNQWSNTGAYRLDYSNFESVFNDIFHGKLRVFQKNDYYFLTNKFDIPYNKIIYGAPGTGKSFKLKEQALRYFRESNIQRVTFHPEYSYSKFVGTYKPVPVYKIEEEEGVHYVDSNGNTAREPFIDYRFTHGVFIRLLKEAYKNPDENYLLIIEEINRANVSAVFGDIFQLLDREPNGQSSYSILLTEEAMTYLEKGTPIKIPSNLYIWATMNSADQGVMPLDSAFKRRWTFEFIPLNENVSINVIKNWQLRIKYKGNEVEISWDLFRKIINNKLALEGISEDKLLGPFFLKYEELCNMEIVKNKLLLYLRDDVLRHTPDKLFTNENRDLTFSALSEKFILDSLSIFKFTDAEIMSLVPATVTNPGE